MTEKKRLKFPLIVEGRYDKSVISSMFSGLIVSLDGFGVFNSQQKQSLIRRISGKGIIVLTDSDGGGRQLRSFVSSILSGDKIYHLYIPKIYGKEPRKRRRSKEGLLGVEGMPPEVLSGLLLPFTEEAEACECREITAAEFFADGFTGSDGCTERRAELARYLSLPDDLSAKAMITAINMLNLSDAYERFVKEKI